MVSETREASHAGSWYTGSASRLAADLDGFLAQVPDKVDGNSLPVPGARVIIAPHAGYSYSGPCAAWAYKALDLSKAKRVFVLGPTHTKYFRGCSLTTFSKYETPFGDLVVDRKTNDDLRKTGRFSKIPVPNDVKEHSLEMHLPFLWHRLEQTFGSDTSTYPPIIPILVGDNNRHEDKVFGNILAPYLEDRDNAFIISSDFCHWGGGYPFNYTKYCTKENVEELKRGELDEVPDLEGWIKLFEGRLAAEEKERKKSNQGEDEDGNKPETEMTEAEKKALKKKQEEKAKREQEARRVKAEQMLESLLDQHPIHASIKLLDDMAIEAIESGVHEQFVDNLRHTGNTVCGRHPIAVMMATMEAVKERSPDKVKSNFKFVQYQRSNLVVERENGTSVSYASAYAVV